MWHFICVKGDIHVGWSRPMGGSRWLECRSHMDTWLSSWVPGSHNGEGWSCPLDNMNKWRVRVQSCGTGLFSFINKTYTRWTKSLNTALIAFNSEENRGGGDIHYIGFTNHFLDRTPNSTSSNRNKINKNLKFKPFMLVGRTWGGSGRIWGRRKNIFKIYHMS